MTGDRGEGWSGADTAWAITGTLMAGILVWGGVGFLIDRWLNLHWLFLPVGMLVGAGTSIYAVYVRYGRER